MPARTKTLPPVMVRIAMRYKWIREGTIDLNTSSSPFFAYVVYEVKTSDTSAYMLNAHYDSRMSVALALGAGSSRSCRCPPSLHGKPSLVTSCHYILSPFDRPGRCFS